MVPSPLQLSHGISVLHNMTQVSYQSEKRPVTQLLPILPATDLQIVPAFEILLGELLSGKRKADHQVRDTDPNNQSARVPTQIHI